MFILQASTINCANYVMFIGLERTLALGHPEAVNVFTQQLLELHRGQVEILKSDFFQGAKYSGYGDLLEG